MANCNSLSGLDSLKATLGHGLIFKMTYDYNSVDGLAALA